MRFLVGDVVIKAHPFSNNRYCLHGGQECDVPIGTKGIVQRVSDHIRVDFSNGMTWNLADCELESDGWEGMVTEKTTKKFIPTERRSNGKGNR